MNYYEEKKYNLWHKQQMAAFKKSKVFLNSEAFKVSGQKPLILFTNEGLVFTDVAGVEFENAIQPVEDWKKTNYSPVEEINYNIWRETQKSTFKKTPEYKKTKFARLLKYPSDHKLALPLGYGDGIEILENGDIKLCTGENFKKEDINTVSWNNHQNNNESIHYIKWQKQQKETFIESKSFLNSESFKLKGNEASIWINFDGSVTIKENELKPEVFYNIVMSWKDWKKYTNVKT